MGYNKREDNFRKWRAQKKAADPTWTLAKEVKQNQDRKRMEQDPNFVPEPAKAPITDDEHLADVAATMKVGDRCEVTVGGKRGVVQYVGKIPQIAPAGGLACSTTSLSARTTAPSRASDSLIARQNMAGSCAPTSCRSATFRSWMICLIPRRRRPRRAEKPGRTLPWRGDVGDLRYN